MLDSSAFSPEVQSQDKFGALPLVSVIIPMFNAGKWIRQTVRSVISQTYPNIEIVVFDDGSTDDSVQIAKLECRRAQRARIIQGRQHTGIPGLARNRALMAATGTFVAFLDSDDLWFPFKIERQVGAITAHREIAMVHSHLIQQNSFGVLAGVGRLEHPTSKIASEESLAERNVVQCSSVLARTEAIRELGGFSEREAFKSVEDLHLWVRVVKSFRVVFINEIHGIYREHEGGISKRENLQVKSQNLDEEFGTQLTTHLLKRRRRVVRRLVGLPWTIALYLSGFLRIWLRKPPKTWG